MKYIFSVWAVALLLSGCFDVPVETNAVAPASTTMDVLSADELMREHSSESLQYQPIANAKTRYYDAQGRLVDKAVKGGFYREILGKTPHGRLVLQDFYQDSEKPYTLPFVAVADAQLKIFHGAGVRDGRTVWLKPDGTVSRVEDFKNGQSLGEIWLFERNKAVVYAKFAANNQKTSVASVAQEASHVAKATHSTRSSANANDRADDEAVVNAKGAASMYFFYPNGKLMAEVETDGERKHHATLYYPKGATMLQIEDNGSQSSRVAWDVNGQKVAPSEVAQESDVLVLRIEYGLNLMHYQRKNALVDLLMSH